MGSEDQSIKRLRFLKIFIKITDAYAVVNGDNNTDERSIAKKQRIEMAASPTFTQPSPISNVLQDFIYLSNYQNQNMSDIDVITK